AEKQFLRALEIKPDYFHSYLQLANLYYIKGDKHKAVESLEKSLQIYPDQPQVRDALARLKAEVR
ncbi:MAG: tetratricopeptide repeat protein, partial [Elusimicrobiota bacterium]